LGLDGSPDDTSIRVPFLFLRIRRRLAGHIRLPALPRIAAGVDRDMGEPGCVACCQRGWARVGARLRGEVKPRFVCGDAHDLTTSTWCNIERVIAATASQRSPEAIFEAKDEIVNKAQVKFLIIFVTGTTLVLWTGSRYGAWQAGVAGLAVAILTTVFPVAFGFLGFEKLHPAGQWFDTAIQLGSQQQRVVAHYSQIEGTLRFWKSKAAAYRRLHLARIYWSLGSGASLPVLVQCYDKAENWSKVFMTILTFWTGLVVVVAHTLRAEEKYQGFRQQESDFYDTSRELLMFTKKEDVDLEQKVDEYLRTIARVRAVGRRVETSSPPSAL
jgi:hypothetical protein